MPTKTKRTSKPTVSIIGAGRLGTAIAIALAESGYRILSLVGRRRQRVRKAAALLDVPCEVLVAKELGKHIPAELVIIAVPDDQIAEVANNLVSVEIPTRDAFTVLHTSGALSSSIFDSLGEMGWSTGSLHPLVSVSDPRVGAQAFRKSFWCIEGDSRARRLMQCLVRDIGGSSFSIDSNAKPLYHAAAVMSSGNVVALFDVALEMLEKCGLSRSQAQKVLLPLLESTIANLNRFPPERAMTGPFSRGDLATVKLHMSALSNSDLHEALELYRLLGKQALKLVEDNLSSEVVKEIQNRLR